MNALVIYESVFGNTAQIAQAIASGLADAIGDSGSVELRHVSEARVDELAGTDLLVVGCPTQKFSPMPATKRFLKGIPKNALAGAKVAAFDTRLTEEELRSHGAMLTTFVNIFGYAAEPIAARLRKKGGAPVVPPAGFYVAGTEGPLLDGEPARAVDWAKRLVARP